MKTDIEIAQNAELMEITEIAGKLGLPEELISKFGKYKAKVDHRLLRKYEPYASHDATPYAKSNAKPDAKSNAKPDAKSNAKPDAKVILVTAISPTPAGEGKTTTTVGLGDALCKLGKKAIICLREPSLGPVFGMKGGAAGGGYAQVVPMEDINLHFTGDIHAIGTANNLLAAMIDNHIYHGNELGIDPRRCTWRRAMDMNDRQLRNIIDGLGGRVNGTPREDGFDITVASEVMAIFCLADSLTDLKFRLEKIIVGYTYAQKPVTAGDLNAHGAMAALLKEAFDPNLVQTLEHTPALIHGGPFANIAHGCNSVIATKLGCKLADYVVTEAGFGADLGAEKFIDIKCRKSGIRPSAVVLVATVRALKHHGGCKKEDLNKPNMEMLKSGLANLKRHIHNITEVYGLHVVVAVNKFPTDTDEELKFVLKACEQAGYEAVLSDVYENGGNGGVLLAEKVLELTEKENNFSFVYEDEMPIAEKIKQVATKVYGADGVTFSAEAMKTVREIEALGYGNLPVCIAKTQYSFSDNDKLPGAPEGFKITIRQIRLSAGAGFVVAIAGNIMTMPGLPKVPAAERIEVNNEGVISGLF